MTWKGDLVRPQRRFLDDEHLPRPEAVGQRQRACGQREGLAVKLARLIHHQPIVIIGRRAKGGSGEGPVALRQRQPVDHVAIGRAGEIGALDHIAPGLGGFVPGPGSAAIGEGAGDGGHLGEHAAGAPDIEALSLGFDRQFKMRRADRGGPDLPQREARADRGLGRAQGRKIGHLPHHCPTRAALAKAQPHGRQRAIFPRHAPHDPAVGEHHFGPVKGDARIVQRDALRFIGGGGGGQQRRPGEQGCAPHSAPSTGSPRALW